MRIVPTANANIYTTTAFTIGLLLADEQTPAEQNSLGNWFMMIGQALCTISAQQQLINNRTNKSETYNSHVINDDNLKKNVDVLKKEIDDILKKAN